jgi:hypothetical protein
VPVLRHKEEDTTGGGSSGEGTLTSCCTAALQGPVLSDNHLCQFYIFDTVHEGKLPEEINKCTYDYIHCLLTTTTCRDGFL